MSELIWTSEIYEASSDAMKVEAGRATPAETTHDPKQLRNTLGNFATGVTVVTYESSNTFRGVTVNSFTSVSMDPPLVLVSLMRTSKALTYLLERPFCINILGDAQMQTALQFAGKPDDNHRIEWVTDDGAPRIDGALAYFQCTPWAGYDGGDHVLLVGRVLSYGQKDETQPLLFYKGKWGSVALNDDEAK